MEKTVLSLAMPLVELTCPSTHTATDSEPHGDSCNVQNFMGYSEDTAQDLIKLIFWSADVWPHAW